ncbi:MAG: class I adenylate-forming enzyme family protein [Solirubrobacterales bacterium]
MTATPPWSRNFGDLVAELAARDGGAAALIEAGGALSFAELEDRVSACAGGLAALGVARGGTVGLLCSNRWEWLCAAFAAHRLGARVAAFNTFAKAWDLGYMVEHSGAEVLVCLDRFRSRDYRATLAELLPELREPGGRPRRLGALREVVVVGDPGELRGAGRFEDLLSAPAAPAASPAPAEADAFVLYTSGSSARPKAVPLRHAAAIENGFAIGERMGLTAADRVLVSVPLFWAYGAVNALPAALGHGAAMVLQPAFEPRAALELVERHRCSAIYTLPNMTAALLEEPGFAPGRVGSLRTGLTIGSEADLRRAASELGVERICNIYGGTETYGNCCVTPAEWPLERRAVSQGPPLPGVRVRIADPGDGGELGPGEIGEIQVHGYLARGYLGDEEATAAAFGGDGWYRSGDLGCLDDQGCLRFRARATEMIKTSGINVSPREVEEVLLMSEDVAAAAVVGVDDERTDEAVVAFVVGREGRRPQEIALREFCAERVAGFKVPARVHVVEQMPQTDTGKLARRRLVELDAAATGGAA